MSNRLKPMGVGTILDYTFSILRERFWTFQWVNFLAFLPVLGVVVLLIIVSVVNAILLSGRDSMVRSGSFTGINFIFVLALFIAVIISMIYFSYANTKIFKAGLHNEKCNTREAFSGIKGKRRKFIGFWFLMILINIPIFIITRLLIIYVSGWGILFNFVAYAINFMFILTGTVLALENLGTFKSMLRAFGLMAKHRWRVLGTLLLVYLLAYILLLILLGFCIIPFLVFFYFLKIINIFTISITMLFGLGALLILSIFVSYLHGPLTAIYYDLLIRKEGYDIQQQLSPSSGGTEPNFERGLNI